MKSDERSEMYRMINILSSIYHVAKLQNFQPLDVKILYAQLLGTFIELSIFHGQIVWVLIPDSKFGHAIKESDIKYQGIL